MVLFFARCIVRLVGKYFFDVSLIVVDEVGCAVCVCGGGVCVCVCMCTRAHASVCTCVCTVCVRVCVPVCKMICKLLGLLQVRCPKSVTAHFCDDYDYVCLQAV